jgi:hypothetical protein
MASQSSARFKRPASPDLAWGKARITYLDPQRSAIAQAYHMNSTDFDVIKDSLVGRRQAPETSLRLLPKTGWLAPFEMLTYAPWWLHLATWIPACVAIYIWVLPHTLSCLALIGLGMLVLWPLVEYTLHRFVFHSSVAWTARYPQWVQGSFNVVRLLLHTVHHAHPTDRLRIITPIPMSLAIAALVFPVLFAVVRHTDAARALAVGMVMGYVQYDYMHYDMHLGADLEYWPVWVPLWLKEHFRKLRRAHRNHHYAPNGHEASFGVTDGSWDWIFGTQAKLRPIAE